MEKDIYNLSVEEVIKNMSSSSEGLTDNEASLRLEKMDQTS